MVVLDSSALIPLAWVGRLDLISATFDERLTTEDVRAEVLVEGKRGTAALQAFLASVRIVETPAAAADVASLEGIAPADASVVLVAVDHDDVLLANDRGLIEVARSQGVETWWVTTLLLSCVKQGVMEPDEAADLCNELVEGGMNLHPKVFARVLRAIESLDP